MAVVLDEHGKLLDIPVQLTARLTAVIVVAGEGG